MSLPEWRTTPTTFGWWFYIDNHKNWDLACPVRVESRQSGNSPINFYIVPDNKLITLDMGLWYGPIEIPKPVIVMGCVPKRNS